MMLKPRVNRMIPLEDVNDGVEYHVDGKFH